MGRRRGAGVGGPCTTLHARRDAQRGAAERRYTARCAVRSIRRAARRRPRWRPCVPTVRSSMHRFRAVRDAVLALAGPATAGSPKPRRARRRRSARPRKRPGLPRDAGSCARTKRKLNAMPRHARTRSDRESLCRQAPRRSQPDAKRYAWAVNVDSRSAPDVRVYPGGRVIVTDALVAKTGSRR